MRCGVGRWSLETSRQGRMYRCGRHHWSSRSNFASGTFPLRMGGRRRSTACSTPCNRRNCTCFPVDTSTQRRTRESGLLGRSKGRQRLTHGTPRKRAAHGSCRARTPAAPRRAATRNRRQPWRSALQAARLTTGVTGAAAASPAVELRWACPSFGPCRLLPRRRPQLSDSASPTSTAGSAKPLLPSVESQPTS